MACFNLCNASIVCNALWNLNYDEKGGVFVGRNVLQIFDNRFTDFYRFWWLLKDSREKGGTNWLPVPDLQKLTPTPPAGPLTLPINTLYWLHLLPFLLLSNTFVHRSIQNLDLSKFIWKMDVMLVWNHSQAIFESKLESAMANAWSADNGALKKREK